MPAPSRGARRAAALVLLAVCLGGCSADPHPATTAPGSSSTAASAAITDLQRRMVSSTGAYSATFRSQTLVDDVEASLTTGKINLHGPFTGRSQTRYPASDDAPAIVLEYLTTEDATYTRQLEPKSGGRKWHRGTKDERSAVGELDGYAELLISRGPGAVNGEEGQNTHLSGRVKAEEVSTLEPGFAQTLRTKKVTSFDCDVWVDESGHVVRLEQLIVMDGKDTHSITTLSKLGAPFTQPAPTA